MAVLRYIVGVEVAMILVKSTVCDTAIARVILTEGCNARDILSLRSSKSSEHVAAEEVTTKEAADKTMKP